MTVSSIATAHQAWQEIWCDQEKHEGWKRPEEEIVEILPLLQQRGVRRALDLGCGIGRHAIWLALQGFKAFGIDASATGIAQADASAEQMGVCVRFNIGSMLDLPFDDNSFDYVVAWHVIFHGDRDSTSRAIGEVARVLRPDGLFQFSLLSSRHFAYGRGREISRDTFVLTEAERDLACEAGPGMTIVGKEDFFRDRQHPHFYSDERTVVDLLEGRFRLLALKHVEHRPRSYHWSVLAERQSLLMR